MKFEDLSPELQDQVKACKTLEEVLALAKEAGYELSDEELASISGGWGDAQKACSGYCFPLWSD